jgi:hypothetical protein
LFYFFLEVVVGKAGGAHTMVAWAEYNFNKASTSKSGTLMKWKASNNASPNEMLSFSMVCPARRPQEPNHFRHQTLT